MKPSVTIDERGVILHLIDADGNGVAIPLNEQTALQLAGQVAVVVEHFKSPEKRGGLLWKLGRALVREALAVDGEKDGKSKRETDGSGDGNR